MNIYTACGSRFGRTQMHRGSTNLILSASWKTFSGSHVLSRNTQSSISAALGILLAHTQAYTPINSNIHDNIHSKINVDLSMKMGLNETLSSLGSSIDQVPELEALSIARLAVLNEIALAGCGPFSIIDL